MGVDFFVTKKGTSDHELYIVSGVNGWRDIWLPACTELGLEIVPFLGDGRYTIFSPEEIPQLLRELTLLRPTMEEGGYERFVETIDCILRVFADTNPEEYEYSFG